MDFKVFCSIGFSLYSLLFILLILIIYLNKRKVRTKQNIIFSVLLLLNIFGCFCEFFYVHCIANEITNLIQFSCKLHEASIILRIYTIAYYAIALRKRVLDKENMSTKNLNIIFWIVSSLLLVNLVCAFLFNVQIRTNLVYTFGGTISSYVMIPAFIVCFISILSLLLGNKIVRKNQLFTLIFTLVVLTLASGLKLFSGSGTILQNYFFTLLTMAIYFTTENQDVKLIDELNVRRKEAEIANDAQTKFLTNVSHEIRTPMNTIIGFAESLKAEENLTQDIVKRDMAYIHDASITLLELINNILDISRIESGQEQLNIKDYKLEDLIFELNSVTAAKMTNKEVTFNINVDHSLPKTLKGDSNKLFKVVSNILTCAVNYTNYGKIDLNINRQKRDDGVFTLEILVANTGHALKLEDFNLSFNDFIKVGTENENTIDGVKLGLMCAKEYIDMLGGRIDFKNEVGKGTRYYIYIDQEIVDNTPCGDMFAHAADKIEHKLFDLTGKKVLVVDDSKVNVKLAKRLLLPYNLQIDTALSGEECIEMVKNNKYDMIFLDHMMPEMDGVTTLKMLKNYDSNLPPTIALTANSYNGAKEKYAELGFNSYLAKPISYKELNKIMYEFFYHEDVITIENDNIKHTPTITLEENKVEENTEVFDEEGVEIL